MNVIIIAACIPTLRPIFLVLLKRPGASEFRASGRNRANASYLKNGDTQEANPATRMSTTSTKAFGRPKRVSSTASTKTMNNKNSIFVSESIRVESRDVDSRDGYGNDVEWGHAKADGVPLSEIGRGVSKSNI